MDQRIPESVQPIVESYVAQCYEQFPPLVSGFYLAGSIALGEFNEYYSDIDFLTVLDRRLSPAEIENLRSIHQNIEKTFSWKMSGSYIQPGDLGKLNDDVEPHPHFHDGILHLDRRNELNAVTWWELKNHGIAVIGMDPQHLPIHVDWNVLIAQMRENLNSYWAGWARRPARMILLHSDWGIQWAVTGVLRQFYTFQENTITTKIKAAEYALGCLPERWHPLIQEAINIRNQKKGSAYRLKMFRAWEAVRFLKLVIQTCNANYPQR
ncbi:MAG TPA: aminoglycoside adenylyltransferase domain-containing protein [Anaerolineales bacterium]|nr:aminoglycoside adenylyltransferase domain-containing protein [Anaerolineales bacterium]